MTENDEMESTPLQTVAGDYSAYTVDSKPIGIGGTSKIYRATKDSKVYAMKIPSNISVDSMDTIYIDPSEDEQFKIEADNWYKASQMVPDSVVCLIDFNTEPFPWMVMEMSEGSFRDRIRDGSASTTDIISILRSLHNIHKSGVVHRDLKPENILMVDGKWKLTDFGLSKVVNNMTKTTTGIKGTPYYMAPEQVSKKIFGTVDRRTDIWQIGIMLYEVIMGRLPYEMTDFGELGMTIIGDGPDYSDAPDIYQPVLKKVLSQDKEERFSTAEEFANALQAIVDQHGDATTSMAPKEIKPKAKKESYIHKTLNNKKKNRIILAILIIVVAVLAITLVYVIMTEPSPPDDKDLPPKGFLSDDGMGQWDHHFERPVLFGYSIYPVTMIMPNDLLSMGMSLGSG